MPTPGEGAVNDRWTRLAPQMDGPDHWSATGDVDNPIL
jgi:hypothetical protein